MAALPNISKQTLAPGGTAYDCKFGHKAMPLQYWVFMCYDVPGKELQSFLGLVCPIISWAWFSHMILMHSYSLSSPLSVSCGWCDRWRRLCVHPGAECSSIFKM